jgi:hypothetical protein
MNLSFYSPLGLREARLNGDPTGMEYQRELGYSVYSRYLELGPGEMAAVLPPHHLVEVVELVPGVRFEDGLDPLRLSVEHFEEVIEEYEAAEEAEAAGKDFKYRWVFPGKFDEPP